MMRIAALVLVVVCIVMCTEGVLISKSQIETCVRDGSVKEPSLRGVSCQRKLEVALAVSGAEVGLLDHHSVSVCSITTVTTTYIGVSGQL